MIRVWVVELKGKHAVVTGGGSGIGRALCQRFAADGASVTSPMSSPVAHAPPRRASPTGGARAEAVTCDVRDEQQVKDLVAAADARVRSDRSVLLERRNRVARRPRRRRRGVAAIAGDQLLAHVYAVRAVLPSMLDRGEGYLLHTASAAGLLTQLGDLPYSVTKHAVVALAEWLSITYGDAGIRVSCLCPQGVNTAMLGRVDGRQRGRRRARGRGPVGARRGRRRGGRGARRGTVPRAPAPRGARVLPAQGRRLRPVAARHAPAPRPVRPGGPVGRSESLAGLPARRTRRRAAPRGDRRTRTGARPGPVARARRRARAARRDDVPRRRTRSRRRCRSRPVRRWSARSPRSAPTSTCPSVSG